MIKIVNLYKRYHNHHGSDWVLRDINLTIPRNVSVGLVGRNGAGKSTLLRLIGGMDSPDKGAISRQCRVSWPIGLGGGFQGSMTGRQNVKFVARIHNHSGDTHKIISQVEEFAEIGEAFDEPVKTYSSGMRARLQFGLSLAFDFDVYLSDEATAVGDRAFKAKAKQAFADRVSKASLIMVSHGEGILKEMCQAGIFLDKGKAAWYDDIHDAIKAYHSAYRISSPAKKQKAAKPKAARKPAAQGKTDSPSPIATNRKEIKRIQDQIAPLKEQLAALPKDAEQAESRQSLEAEIASLRKKIRVHRDIIKQLNSLEENDSEEPNKELRTEEPEKAEQPKPAPSAPQAPTQ
ncbi:ATP-binding cassette domain-containing protein [Salinicola corii]|uniref:ATP-binding cassette domain-containing protein n=1 Tax=Salinicola corii TaxID=2606937 RepID=A0A640WFH2_9GAMM|nr:ABC transporter ATP-binding protein [Salinicola corii]KAA0019008.1 ATP-binding cassette domain-containing protein [Salinicola corii]